MSRLLSIENNTNSADSIGNTSHYGTNNTINTDEFWTSFERFLSQTNNRRSTKDRLNYARHYAHIIEKGDARELLELKDDKRIHAMKGLSALSKYTGCYDKWKQIQQSFQLKWSNCDSLQAFRSIFNSEKDLDHMISWLKDVCLKLPQYYANVLVFNTVTGLRPSEACMAITLIHNNNINNYLNQNTQTLEHFRFPYFIRRTKKAYISLINEQIMEIVEHTDAKVTYDSLKGIFKRLNLDMHTSFCRKIFATFLRTQGIEQEIIDLLQGRLPRSIFVRHYFRPNFNEESKKVIASLNKLEDKILQ